MTFSFSPYSRSYSVHFSFSIFLRTSHHTPGQSVFVSHFLVFQFTCNIPGPTVGIFHFSRFSVPCHIPGPTVCISYFSRFWVSPHIFVQKLFVAHCHDFRFLEILQVLQCAFLIFHGFYFSCRNPGSMVCISPSSRFSLFLAISQFLQCVFLIWHFFRCFSPYGRCHSVCVSFSNIFFF